MTKSNERADASATSRGDPPAARAAAAGFFPLPSDAAPPAAREEEAAALPETLFGAPIQACLIGFSAFARYSSAVADALGRYEAGLAEAGVTPGRGLSALQDRAFVDETRALLRRMGEAASLEARRAQVELEKVGKSVARAAAAAEGGADPQAPYVRRHEVKA